VRRHFNEDPAAINLVDEREKIAAGHIEALKSKPETAAIIKLGGGRRNGYRPYADRHSDIDVAVVLDLPVFTPDVVARWLSGPAHRRGLQHLLPAWLPNTKFKVPDHPEISNFSSFQLILQVEESRQWTIPQAETYAQTASFAYCRQNNDGGERRVFDLVRQQRAGAFQLLATDAFEFATMQALVAKDTGTCVARDMLDAAAQNVRDQAGRLVNTVFLTNGLLPPSVKWRNALAVHLPWKPTSFDQLVRVARRALDTPDVVLEYQHTLNESMNDVCDQLNRLGIISLSDDGDATGSTAQRTTSDNYAELQAHRTARQLRTRTSADGLLDEGVPYDARLGNDQWNSANFSLNG
jgi:hypothetical protein